MKNNIQDKVKSSAFGGLAVSEGDERDWAQLIQEVKEAIFSVFYMILKDDELSLF